MAYVESFYLDADLVKDQEAPMDIEKAAETVAELLHGHEELEKSENAEKPAAIVSDYCGFESEEMPPVYRAQMRSIQKKQLVEKEEKEKSQYAYPVEKELVKKKEEQNVELNDTSIDYYVPGFSPPQQNEEIHKMNNFKLPKSVPISATEHVFQMAIGLKHEASQYILMPNEDEEVVNSKIKPSEMTSAVSYTDTGFSAAEDASVLTATLGPAFGCLKSVMSPAPKSMLLADKYKGLSAFRPVSGSIESQYALPDLN